MNSFISPNMFIVDYYDSLINQIDIHTESLLARTDPMTQLDDVGKINDVNELIDFPYMCENPYSDQYKLTSLNYEEIMPSSMRLHDYANRSRERMIAELRKAQDEAVDYYKANRDKFDYDPARQMTEESVEKLRAQLFANKFCFLIENIHYKHTKGKKGWIPKPSESFELFLIIIDFYIDADLIRLIKVVLRGNLSYKRPWGRAFQDYNKDYRKEIFEEKELLVYLLGKYISQRLRNSKYGSEIIQIGMTSLLSIEKISLNFLNCFKTVRKINIDNQKYDWSNLKSFEIIRSSADSNDNKNRIILSLPGLSKIEFAEFYANCHFFIHTSNLVSLRIYNCDLTNCESIFANLNNLKCLDIHNVKGLNNSCLNGLNKLIYLKMHNCNIHTKEANEFFDNNKMPNLVILNLCCNHLSEFQNKWISSCKNLERLIVNYNQIQDLDFLECESLSNLVDLDLSYNKISSIKRENLSKLVKLKCLRLNEHTIVELPPRLFSNLSNLEELHLRRYNFKEAKRLTIEKETFLGLNNLIYLNLFNNSIDRLDPTAFAYTPKLMKLNLDKNRLNINKDFFSHLKNLKTISVDSEYLSKNSFKYINKSHIEVI